jgi:hypothetical protein
MSRDISLYANWSVVTILRFAHSIDLNLIPKATVRQTAVHQLPFSAIVRCTACEVVKHRDTDKGLLESQIPQITARRYFAMHW